MQHTHSPFLVSILIFLDVQILFIFMKALLAISILLLTSFSHLLSSVMSEPKYAIKTCLYSSLNSFFCHALVSQLNSMIDFITICIIIACIYLPSVVHFNLFLMIIRAYLPLFALCCTSCFLPIHVPNIHISPPAVPRARCSSLPSWICSSKFFIYLLTISLSSFTSPRLFYHLAAYNLSSFLSPCSVQLTWVQPKTLQAGF